VSWKRYAPGREILNGPTRTPPRGGEKVNAPTSLPFSDSRTSPVPARLVKKRSVTAQPLDVRATSGRPRLRAANVAVGRGVALVNVPEAASGGADAGCSAGGASGLGAASEKVADADWEPFAVTVQVRPLPLHAPPQPEKVTPVPGDSVKVTAVAGG
jgi:hypothetical protein